MKLLITFQKDWADEFDVYGLAIMSQTEWDSFKAGIPTLTYGFGTNEGWEEPGDFDEDDFVVTTISAVDEEILRATIFGEDDTYGHFPS